VSSGSRHLFTRFLTRRITPGLLAVAVMSFGCGGGGSPTAVTPSIAAISPTRGSTGGGTTLRITGSGFQPGALASLDAEPGGAVVETAPPSG
jgi:IPT/TIG domain